MQPDFSEFDNSRLGDKDQKPTAVMLTAASHVTQHNYSNDNASIYLNTSTEPAWSPPKFEFLQSLKSSKA